MDSSHDLDSHLYHSDTPSTTSTATALHLNIHNNSNASGGGAGGLAPPRNMANRRTSLADIISRVRRTSAGLQSSHPLHSLAESKSELPHYSVPGEKFADKRVKVSGNGIQSLSCQLNPCFQSTAPQHPRNDGGGGWPETPSRNGIVVPGRKEVPLGCRKGRCGQLKKVLQRQLL